MALGFEGVSFLPKSDESGKGSFALGGFFAFTLAASEFDAIVLDRAFEKAVMIGTGSGDNVILGRLRGKGLEQFLEFALGIFECGYDRQGADDAMKLPQNEFARRLKPAIEKNRAE